MMKNGDEVKDRQRRFKRAQLALFQRGYWLRKAGDNTYWLVDVALPERPTVRENHFLTIEGAEWWVKVAVEMRIAQWNVVERLRASANAA